MADNHETINLLEIQIRKFVDSMRPPEEMREQLDVGFTFENNTLELFEVRPRSNKRDEMMYFPFATAKLIKSRGIWRLFWKRASGKWESYEPVPEVKDLAGLFEVIKKDQYGCFFG
jgi:hypothetical protein